MQIYQINIDFNITEQIKRYVYVYLIETEKECYLVDSGVSGSETMIEEFVVLKGHKISDIKAYFLLMLIRIILVLRTIFRKNMEPQFMQVKVRNAG